MININQAPVIVGTGQINDRQDDISKALDAGTLMQAAIIQANENSGGRALRSVDTLELVRLFSAPMDGIVDRLQSALPGLRSRPEFIYGHGNTPMLLLNRAASRIARGEVETCIISGAEAYLSEKRLATLTAGAAGHPDMMKKNLEGKADAVRRTYGLVTPIEIYPLFENAMRAAWGQTLEAAQAESADIWSKFSEVAAQNPNAWIQRPYSPHDILKTGPGNRKLNFPYSTLMVANNSVNQGAAIIICSYSKARALGIPEENMIFVGAGAAATEPQDVLARDTLSSSPSLRATIGAALERNTLDAAQFDHLELYSCFPCVPKHARRVANFRQDLPFTVTGGLTFAGGPIRNYMMHAAASMVDKLRDSGTYGLLFGNGGYLSEAHALVLSRMPILSDGLKADFNIQQRADNLRGEVPILHTDYVGPGQIESYTVAHDRAGEPQFGTIVGRTPNGHRFLCRAEPDQAMMEFLMSGKTEPVGTSGRVEKSSLGYQRWQLN